MQLADGYTDLPAGKIANVVTCLEMFAPPPPRPEPPAADCTIERVESPDLQWYRALFRRVGEPYLWFSALVLPDGELRRMLNDPAMEIFVLRYRGRDEGLLQLDFRTPGECELLYFGVGGDLLGKGFGRRLMNRALRIAWSHPIRRMWVHTCTLDHPDAVAFYMRSGFRPFKRQIEYTDDPRVTGALPRDAAPQIPLI